MKLIISDISENKFEFDSLDEFYEFCVNERNWWEGKYDLIMKEHRKAHKYIVSYSHFNTLIAKLNELRVLITGYAIEDKERMVTVFVRENAHWMKKLWLWSGYYCSRAFAKLNESKSSREADEFIGKVLLNKHEYDTASAEYIGRVFFDEFKYNNPFSHLKKEKEVALLKKSREEIELVRESFLKEVIELKAGYDKEIKEKCNEIEVSKNNMIDVSMGDILKLKNLYERKLMLSEPAEYWRKSAEKYFKQGLFCSLVLAISIFMGLLMFLKLFNSMSIDTFLDSVKMQVSYMLVFIVIVTVYAYWLKFVSKLTFSSFHLMRDSEERNQLTYLYLSLKNANGIDDNSIDIVLQALFCRTETGLLGGDSSPTMPGVTELIKNLLKTK